MTKPSNFILNSDYLTLAQYGETSYTIYVPAGNTSVALNMTRNFTVPSQTGALDRVLISVDGQTTVGTAADFQLSSLDIGGGIIQVYRISSSVMQAKIYSLSYGVTADYPAHTITIQVACFKPPNIF